jgi:hypothetical protein
MVNFVSGKLDCVMAAEEEVDVLGDFNLENLFSNDDGRL